MKHVVAIIQPQKLAEVREALHGIGIDALIVNEVQRYGTHEAHHEYYRGADYEVGFMPKTKIEIFTPDDQWEDAVDAITRAASSGKVGDGRVFVSNLEHSIQIRSGRTDSETEAL